MQQLGFGIFGYAGQHICKSNGLFKEMSIEGETYMSLPGKTQLLPGERIIKIGRTYYKNKHVIKIYIFDHANDPSKRFANGFVGSAYVFSGIPSQKLLFDKVRHLHNKALSVLDSSKTVNINALNNADSLLISEKKQGLVQGNYLQKISDSLNDNDFCYFSDGPVLESLMLAVQGFMFNRNFQNIRSLYLTNNKELANRLNQKGITILNIGNLLNYGNHFKNLDDNFKKRESKYNEELKNKKNEINQFINEKKDELETLDNDISIRENKFNTLTNDISNKENDFKQLEVQYKKDFQKAEEKKLELNKLKEEVSSLGAKKYDYFKQIINDPNFSKEKDSYENEIKTSLKRKFIPNNEEDKNSKNFIQIHKLAVILLPIIIFLFGLIISYGITNLFPKILLSTAKDNIIENKKAEEKQNLDEEWEGLPEDKSFAELIALREDSLKGYRKKIKEFLEKANSSGQNNIDFKNAPLYNRNWNLAELINPDSSSSHQDQNLQLLYNLYNKQNTYIIDKCAFALGGEKVTLDSTDDFKAYLKKNEYIYERLGFYFKVIKEKGEHKYDEESISYKIAERHFEWLKDN